MRHVDLLGLGGLQGSLWFIVVGLFAVHLVCVWRGRGLRLDLRGWSGFGFGPRYGANWCVRRSSRVGSNGIGQH